MKSTKHHFTLETGGYLVIPEIPNSHKYKVFYDGKEIFDVVGIVRVHLEEFE